MTRTGCSRTRRRRAICVSADGYRLYEKRDALVKNLLDHVAMNRDWLFESLEYPLAFGAR